MIWNIGAAGLFQDDVEDEFTQARNCQSHFGMFHPPFVQKLGLCHFAWTNKKGDEFDHEFTFSQSVSNSVVGLETIFRKMTNIFYECVPLTAIMKRPFQNSEASF
jgi:hypothetical protein